MASGTAAMDNPIRTSPAWTVQRSRRPRGFLITGGAGFVGST